MKSKILLLVTIPLLFVGCKSSYNIMERHDWEKIYEADEEVNVTIPASEGRGRVFVIGEDTFINMINCAIEESL